MSNHSRLNEFSNSSTLPCDLFLGEVFSWKSANWLIKFSKSFAIAANLITSPFTLLFNGFVFLTVSRNRLLQKPRLVVLACLACTDFFSGLVCQPLFVAKEMYFLTTTRPNCFLEEAFYLCAYITLAASFPQLLIVTYERYTGITKPFRYDTHITNGRLICATVVIWVQVTTETVFYFNYPFTESDIMIANFIGIFLSLAVFAFIIYFHLTIAVVVRRHRAQIEHQQRDLAFNTDAARRVRFQKKSSISVVFLIFFLVATYFPLYICYGLLNVFGEEIRQQAIFCALPLVETLALLSSFFNPIIYCLRTSEFKQKMSGCFGSSLDVAPPSSCLAMDAFTIRRNSVSHHE